MVLEHQLAHDSQRAAIESIAEKIGSTSRYSEVRQNSNQSACAVLTGGPVTSAAPFNKRQKYQACPIG